MPSPVKLWKNFRSGGTPLSAEELNIMEELLEAYSVKSKEEAETASDKSGSATTAETKAIAAAATKATEAETKSISAATTKATSAEEGAIATAKATSEAEVAAEKGARETEGALKLVKSGNLAEVADAGSSRANVHVPALTPVLAVATSNIATLSGLQAIDGVTPGSGAEELKAVLLTAQTESKTNGIWNQAAGAWTRPTEFAEGLSIKARTVAVTSGTEHARSEWLLNTTTSATVGMTAQAWVERQPPSVVNGSLGYVTGLAANGVTDDKTAILAWITANLPNGGVAILPQTKVIATSPLDVPANVWLVCPPAFDIGGYGLSQPRLVPAEHGQAYTVRLSGNQSGIEGYVDGGAIGAGNNAKSALIINGIANRFGRVLATRGTETTVRVPSEQIECIGDSLKIWTADTTGAVQPLVWQGTDAQVGVLTTGGTAPVRIASADGRFPNAHIICNNYVGATGAGLTDEGGWSGNVTVDGCGGVALIDRSKAGKPTRYGDLMLIQPVAGITGIPMIKETTNASYGVAIDKLTTPNAVPAGSGSSFSYVIDKPVTSTVVGRMWIGPSWGITPSNVTSVTRPAGSISNVMVDYVAVIILPTTGEYTHIDMCKPPYNCVPGEEITVRYQEAINEANALNGGMPYFSQPGRYKLEGAQQTGEYNGGVETAFTPTTLTAINGTVINLTGAKSKGFTNGQRVQFTTLTSGVTNIKVNTAYWIVGEATNGFEVSLTEGGAALKVEGHELETATTKVGLAAVYSYSGQILFPARTTAESQATIHTKGCVAPTKPLLGTAGEETLKVPGVVLVSNATTGNVFDCIPTFAASKHVWTNLNVIFEDITIQVPPNPQCGGVNLQVAKCSEIRGHVRVEGQAETEGFIWGNTALTGAGAAITFPQINNGGSLLVEKLSIFGFPTAIAFTEHLEIQYAFIGHCIRALEPYGASHANVFGYADVEECTTALYSRQGISNPGAVIYGFIDHENVTSSGAWVAGNFIEDPENQLRGEIRVRTEYTQEKGGYPCLGGLNLNVINVMPEQLTTGPLNEYASDTFLRGAVIAGNIGACSRTNHPWTISKGTSGFTIKNETTFGKLSMTKSEEGLVVVRNRYQGNGSRTIRTEITPSATPANTNLGIAVNGGAGKDIWVRFREGKLQILAIAGSVGAEVAQAGGSLLDLSVVVNCPPVRGEKTGRAPTLVQAFINGVEKLSYAPTTAERETMATAETQLYFEDGLRWNKDTESTVQWFDIKPLLPAGSGPVEHGRSAAMVAGKITIAAPAVTATGAISITTEGGTAIGASVVERTAGTGFKVEATATSTDVVNWQVFT